MASPRSGTKIMEIVGVSARTEIFLEYLCSSVFIMLDLSCVRTKISEIA